MNVKRISVSVFFPLYLAVAPLTAHAAGADGASADAAQQPTSASTSFNPVGVIKDGYSCTCAESYKDGRETNVLSCDNAHSRCADVSVLNACKDDPDGAGCDNNLLSCECDCTAVDPTTEFEHGPFEDVFLTGIPNLWQFDFMCGDNNVSANPVGCGPVAAAMVMYWWAQQGYEGLVDEFLHGSGSPAEELHDWQDLVRELRADYLDGGICLPVGGGLYATPMWEMTTGLREYIEDAGYAVDVDHWKVCEDCNAGATDEILGGAALNLIKDELEAGRPVIMGFNAGKTFDLSIPVPLEDGTFEMIYAGELSNGTLGFIDHYAVITGYRRMGGLDVLTLNRGWQDEITDVDVLWNPAGKWLHLHTVDITSAPDGVAWCSIDRGVDYKGDPLYAQADAFLQPYIDISHVEHSRPSKTNQLTPLAGTRCGIARESVYVTYYDTTHQLETCPTAAHLPDLEEALDHIYQGEEQTGGHDSSTEWESEFPILDDLGPGP